MNKLLVRYAVALAVILLIFGCALLADCPPFMRHVYHHHVVRASPVSPRVLARRHPRFHRKRVVLATLCVPDAPPIPEPVLALFTLPDLPDVLPPIEVPHDVATAPAPQDYALQNAPMPGFWLVGGGGTSVVPGHQTQPSVPVYHPEPPPTRVPDYGVPLYHAQQAPEIDPSSAGSAVALLAGLLAVIRGRKRV